MRQTLLAAAIVIGLAAAVAVILALVGVLPARRRCPHCRAVIKADARVCPRCGGALAPVPKGSILPWAIVFAAALILAALASR